MKCIVPDCSSNYYWKKEEAVTFHTFPKSIHHLWCKLLNIKAEWKISRKICSLHFNESDLDRTGQTVRLRTGVVPSLLIVKVEDAVGNTSDATKVKPKYSEVIVQDLQTNSTIEEALVPSVSLKSDIFKVNEFNNSSEDNNSKKQESSLKRFASWSSTSGSDSESEDTIAKRKKFIATIHSYSVDVSKPRNSLAAARKRAAQYRRKLYNSKRNVDRLKETVQSLKEVIKNLSR